MDDRPGRSDGTGSLTAYMVKRTLRPIADPAVAREQARRAGLVADLKAYARDELRLDDPGGIRVHDPMEPREEWETRRRFR